MRQRTYSTEAVIIARRNLGEADRILTVFSKHYGKLRVVAKGVRRPESRKRGELEIFNQVRFLLAKTKNLDIVTDVQVKNSFQGWRKNLRKVATAYHFLEVVDKLTREEQENEHVFEILTNALSQLDKTSELEELKNEFDRKILVELGFWRQGLPLTNPAGYIEKIAERKLSSERVGRKLSSF